MKTASMIAAIFLASFIGAQIGVVAIAVWIKFVLYPLLKWLIN